jgi:2-methylcitrate dehydratase PrpD
MADALSRLGRWAAGVEFDDLPAPAVEAAKDQVYSILAAVHAGFRSDLGKPILRAFAAAGGSGGAHAAPAGIATTPAHAAFLMAAWAMVLDFDDIMLGGHTGHSTVLVPLAYCEALKRSGKDLLTAQIVANELAARINMSVALGPTRGQMATHVHLVGAAAARGSIERLDETALAEAMAFALSYPGKALYPAFLGSDAKALCAAWPIRTGLESVDAVRAGMRGNVGILEDPRGFIRTLARTPVPEFLDELGRRWHTPTNSIKPYPACGYINAALDATLFLVRTHDIDPCAVQAVDVDASIFTVGMDMHSSPYLKGPDSLVSTLTFSTPFTLACAILDRDVSGQHLTRERIRDPRLWSLAQKIRVHHDIRHTIDSVLADIPIGATLKHARRMTAPRFLLSVGGPALVAKMLLREPLALCRLVAAVSKAARSKEPLDVTRSEKRLSAGVRIRTTDGASYEKTVEIPTGFAGSGDRDAMRVVARKKYLAQASPAIGITDALRAADMIGNLEQLAPSDVAQLIRLNCVAAARSGSEESTGRPAAADRARESADTL